MDSSARAQALEKRAEDELDHYLDDYFRVNQMGTSSESSSSESSIPRAVKEKVAKILEGMIRRLENQH